MTQMHLLWPEIVKRRPPQKGKDNEGVGFTRHGEEYILKLDEAVCLAEFVGAGLCGYLGVPTYEPTVVSYRGRPVFGGRLESGLKRLKSESEYIDTVKQVSNRGAFSSVLALDLALGNNDRHWDNWLYQSRDGGAVLARAIDFSRAWPTAAPPRSCEALRNQNTHLAWQQWQIMDIDFDAQAFNDACAKLRSVQADWLEYRFEGLPVEWMTGPDGPALCHWWRGNWSARIDAVQSFMNNGAWT